jgi:hypothetical protein
VIKQERQSSFLKKRSKKLLLWRCANVTTPWAAGAEPNEPKFFGSFFQKRTAFLTAVPIPHRIGT